MYKILVFNASKAHRDTACSTYVYTLDKVTEMQKGFSRHLTRFDVFTTVPQESVAVEKFLYVYGNIASGPSFTAALAL